MIYKLTDLNSWPLTDNGEPIFNTTNDALLYAQLIYNMPGQQDLLAGYRHKTYQVLKFLREQEDPDFNKMMEEAVRAQFLSECLEECKRIKQEKSNH